jgi:hypothetical protein
MKKDGGPAFPADSREGNYHEELRIVTNGMTLRDYFAAAALQGILAAGQDWTNIARGQGGSGVALAYSYADSMLIEREKS